MNRTFVNTGRPKSIKHFENSLTPNVVPGSIMPISAPKDIESKAPASKMIAKIFSPKVLLRIKYTVAVLSFFGILGVIGGFEAGILSLGKGLAAAAAMVIAEIICLRR